MNRQTFKYALIKTIPVMCGYLFLGLAYGLLMQDAGYDARWSLFTSMFVYAGSMQFVMVGFMGTSMSLASVALMTLSVNSRHFFYGLSFIEEFKSMGARFPYMVFSLSDETYSLLIAPDRLPEGVSRKNVSFLVAMLDQFYWVMGSLAGGLLGQLIPFDMTGIDFAMTSLFVVIFVDQWRGAKTHLPALIGIVCGVASLLLFGTTSFLLPALFATCALLLILERPITNAEVSTIEA